MKTIRVCFENSKHNYITSVAGHCTEKELREYFVNSQINVGYYVDDRTEGINLQVCTNIEFI